MVVVVVVEVSLLTVGDGGFFISRLLCGNRENGSCGGNGSSDGSGHYGLVGGDSSGYGGSIEVISYQEVSASNIANDLAKQANYELVYNQIDHDDAFLVNGDSGNLFIYYILKTDEKPNK